LKSRIDQKSEVKINKLKAISKQKKCIFPTNQKENENSIYFKKELLKESSHELCKYNYYLNYLKDHSKNIKNAS
jgi:hypothetical protein